MREALYTTIEGPGSAELIRSLQADGVSILKVDNLSLRTYDITKEEQRFLSPSDEKNHCFNFSFTYEYGDMVASKIASEFKKKIVESGLFRHDVSTVTYKD